MKEKGLEKAYRDGVRFVDGDDVRVKVEDGEREGGDWRLVTMDSVDQEIIVL